MTPEVKQVYVGMLEVLDNPERWIKGQAALDKDDSPVCPEGERACRWCMWGAGERVDVQLMRTRGSAWRGMWESPLDRLLRERFPERMNDCTEDAGPISLFNDHTATTHTELLEVLRDLVDGRAFQQAETRNADPS